MTFTFGEEFFKSNYDEYKNYPHFYERALWLNDYYISNKFSKKIIIVGCGFGYTIKHLLEINPDLTDKVLGIDISQYCYEKAIEMGLEKHFILSDAIDFDWKNEEIDLICSWNFLDCLPDEQKATELIELFNQNSTSQLHISCISDETNELIDYSSQGFFIRSIDFWANIIGGVASIIVQYDSGNVYMLNDYNEWVFIEGLKIPLCWDKVSL